MNYSFFLTIFGAATGCFVFFRKFRFNQDIKEIDSSHPSSFSISSVPSSSSSQNWTHDVFPSFRGEDVRIDLLSHIQKEFKRKGITPFNDNRINRGGSIGPELIKAIRGSKIAIILLSRNYASSKWCLDELVEIMKCREELGQTVMVVFYKVDPSDVKKLTGYFGKVFRKTCVGKSKEDIGRWKETLAKVSRWDNEAAMIEEIATDVSNKLISSVPSSDFNSLVGMRAHMENMDLLLRLDSNEVRMIGIWGPSGIGKSTIARSLFSQHSPDFQLSVFMENIKREYPRPCAQLQLQNKFLSLILNQKDVTIHHLGVAQDRLKDKKVLVVLDDVDQSAQLDALAKELWWFGPGSRVIVTTQDKRILKAHPINLIYEVGFPHDDEALEIFCINAFGQKSPYDGFGDLALEVTKLVGKLPLGLSVVGSYFKGLSKEEWEHELPRLRTRLDGDIESILKLSYDTLCNDDQALFLHIACFFNGRHITIVEECLAENFSGIKGRLRVLAERSLISVDSGVIKMHDLLALLGREIVRKQAPYEPGQRQFLVDDEDICKVLSDGTLGSRSVIGITIELGKELKVSDRAFERMSNVQFLNRSCDFSYHGPYVLDHSPYVLESLICLPRELKLLDWTKFPMTCLPSSFNPEFLVGINMSFSKLEKLWEGNKTIRNLKWLKLTEAKNLKELPDLSTAINLRRLDLWCCSSLILMELPFSIGNLINLENLNITGCSSLVELPFSIGNITTLKELELDGCSSLVELPFSIGNMANLKKLELNGCSSLVELPFSIGNMTNLEKTKFNELSFVNCFKLNQEARDLILKTSTKRWAIFPGETVPAYFSYRATGSSVSMKLNGFDTHFPTSLGFKACLLLVTKPSYVEPAWYFGALNKSDIFYCIKDKLSGVKVNSVCCSLWGKLSQQSEHLLVFEIEETVSSPELVFEFGFRRFLSHIQKEFRRKGITPFIDNEIRRGESIGPELIRAIRGSKIAIILLSRNYASSKWCLDELVEIMKCKEELGQTVIPVFYKVDPSHVKKLRGYFGKVFEKTCEGKSKEDTEKWRHALEKVATIAGYDSSTWDNEAAMIEEVATDVSNKLINSAPSSDFDSLVGMKAHMKSMELLLRLDSDEVRMIGIWGPSGIGKSTIARSLFSQHSPDFQLSVFMENIKREYPRPCFDRYSAQVQLQNKFLSLILNQNDVTIHHLGVAQDRLKNKKVLVVLDDVDHSAQLDALAKETCWFGSGSRIIVTTQDKRILNAHQINHIYKVDFPRDDEALEIFCMNAFGQKSPYDGFGDLACKVTDLAGKLPLCLSVMGSHFKGLTTKEWEQELTRLRTRLDSETESILKFSYDALCDEDQALFLHIACLFNGERIDKVEEFLAEKFVAVKSRLRVLAEKSLISVDSEGYIRMHDLLARLGREVVRKQSPNEPGQRQFLVDDGDIRQVLRDDTLGSRSVIGINFLLEKELKISDQAFERMSNLQFLRLDGHYVDHILLVRTNSQYILESVNCLPREVRLLHWRTFPMTCLPSNFNPELLMEIKMSCSNLEKLWEGNKTIRNLKWMDLSHSINLKELPNLSTATNLRELDLDNCSSLVELPSSIGNLTNLKRLNLKLCSSLMELPSSICNMTNLENLDLSGCLNLSFPYSIGNMTNLENLDLKGCSSLVELPYSIGNMTNLETLDLNGCSSLVELPSSIGNLHNLKKLNLRNCSTLMALPVNINMKSLVMLDLSFCSVLKSFPEISTNISFLEIIGTAIEEIPTSIRSWSRLDTLDMSYSENLRKSHHAFDLITNLHLSHTGIQEISPLVKEMSRLQTLVINGCMDLVSLPQLPDSLEFMHVENCESLERLDCSFYRTKLSDLRFVNCLKLNREAVDLILKTSIERWAIFPGETVPAYYFSYRATGSFVSMKLNGLDARFPTSLRDLKLASCWLLTLTTLSLLIGTGRIYLIASMAN
ncbi:unnamed protein product [Brassica oleracea var. botrytis]